MSDEKKLMGIPFKMLRMDDERTGLSSADIAIWKATHPDTKYADVPTTEEIVQATDTDSVDDTDDTDEIEVPTEEARLRQLLSALLKSIREYFCSNK